MSATQTRPHRHQPGEHTESELRYLTPGKFSAPDSLGDMSLTLSCPNPHVDRYYDAPVSGRPALRRAGASVRVRVKASGDVLATFKLKLSDKGARSRRQETEDAVACPACLCPAAQCGCGLCGAADNYVSAANLGASAALTKARATADGQPLVFLFSIANERHDHHYRSADAHVVLSEDLIGYPDGSTERRVEVEHVAGDPAALDLIDVELRARFPQLTACKRGKLSEGRRRLAALLA